MFLLFQRLAVSIFVSGFVCEEKDYVDPWEQIEVNSERYITLSNDSCFSKIKPIVTFFFIMKCLIVFVRYALQWESKNLIALSTATQEWFTSSNLLDFVFVWPCGTTSLLEAVEAYKN